MRKVNITELRSHLPQYLASVEEGKEIFVTSHGKIIARILPAIDAKREALEQLKRLRKHCKIGDIIFPIGEEWERNK